MNARDAILGRIRQHLKRPPGAVAGAPPEVRIAVPEMETGARIEAFTKAVEALAGKVFRAGSHGEVLPYAAELIGERQAVASNSPLLAGLGITGLPHVRSGLTGCQALREACAAAGVGITGASYALADTGSLVMFSSIEEPRLISLLPPVHLAVVESSRILTGLDELLSLTPLPADITSSMVLITGPSRTADIEQILVRGVHGPGELHVVIV